MSLVIKKYCVPTFLEIFTNSDSFVNGYKASPLYLNELTDAQLVVVYALLSAKYGNTIAKYNGEHKTVISMRPYLDEIFNTKARDQIIQQFDFRGFTFRNLITFKQFQKFVELVKPRK